jgi:hypothetical protein
MPNIRKKLVRKIVTLLHLIPTESRPAEFGDIMKKLHKKIGAKAAADYPSSRTGSAAARGAAKAGTRTRTPRGRKASGGKSAVGTRAPRRAPSHS